jgi:hypothetical protein
LLTLYKNDFSAMCQTNCFVFFYTPPARNVCSGLHFTEARNP